MSLNRFDGSSVARGIVEILSRTAGHDNSVSEAEISGGTLLFWLKLSRREFDERVKVGVCLLFLISIFIFICEDLDD